MRSKLSKYDVCKLKQILGGCCIAMAIFAIYYDPNKTMFFLALILAILGASIIENETARHALHGGYS